MCLKDNYIKNSTCLKNNYIFIGNSLASLCIQLYVRATSTCLKSNCLKIIGLYGTTTKNSHLLRDGITNYICYLKI